MLTIYPHMCFIWVVQGIMRSAVIVLTVLVFGKCVLWIDVHVRGFSGCCVC